MTPKFHEKNKAQLKGWATVERKISFCWLFLEEAAGLLKDAVIALYERWCFHQRYRKFLYMKGFPDPVFVWANYVPWHVYLTLLGFSVQTLGLNWRKGFESPISLRRMRKLRITNINEHRALEKGVENNRSLSFSWILSASRLCSPLMFLE
jgi:hypothetical protein